MRRKLGAPPLSYSLGIENRQRFLLCILQAPLLYSPPHHNPTMPAKRAPQISSNASTVPPIPKATSSTPNKSAATSSSSSSKSSSSSSSAQTAQEVLLNLWQHYLNTTPQRVKLIDVFMAFLVVVGGLQFVYCVLVGNYVRLFSSSLLLLLLLLFFYIVLQLWGFGMAKSYSSRQELRAKGLWIENRMLIRVGETRTALQCLPLRLQRYGRAVRAHG